MEHSNAQTPNPQCPICHGKGFHETPYYEQGRPRIETIPCQSCNPVNPMRRIGCSILVVLWVALIAFVASRGR